MDFLKRLFITVAVLAMVFSCSSTEDKINGNIDDVEIFMKNWSQIHNITDTDEELSEPIKCSKIGRAASKLIFMLNLSSKSNNTVEFHLSTRKNRNGTLLNMDSLKNKDALKHFNPKAITYVIVHGWLSNATASWVIDMKEALLNWNDVNVITVDWSCTSRTLKYWRAIASIENVGTNIATFMNRLRSTSKMAKNNFHFIGHSLGAHISSFAASKMGKIKRITGLDPAHTCVITDDQKYLLDTSDAEFVDVIHTSATLLVKFGFGTRSRIGHVDFYPNGGEKQPECFENLSRLSKIIPLYKRIAGGVCSHGRAYDLFTESIKKANCPFMGHKWDRTTESIDESINGACTTRDCSLMGIYADRFPARGSFYVPTQPTEKYCSGISQFLKKIKYYSF